MDDLVWLMEWYASQCNNDWERQFGVQLTTTDSPGWHLTVNLAETEISAKQFETIQHSANDSWWSCVVQDNTFLATCGPRNLPAVLAIFRSWAQKK